MSNFYTFLKGIMATLMLLVAPVAMAQGVALPQGLAGNYTYKVADYLISDPDVDASGFEKSYTGEMTVDENGKVLMTGLVNTPAVYEMVEGEVTSVKKAYEGTYDAATQTVTFHQPEGSTVTDLVNYQGWTAKDFTLKVQMTSGGHYVLTATDDVTYMDTDGNGVSLKLQGVKMYQEGSEGEGLSAPAELAGKYMVSLGTPTFKAEGSDEGGEGEVDGDISVPGGADDAAQWPTSYKVTVTVEDGAVHMTGLIGTPVVADDDEFGFGTVPSYYVGAYDDEAQTLTFSLPEGAQIVDEAAGSIYSLANPFTLKLSLDENGKYVMSTTQPVEFTVVGETNGTLSYADATFNAVQAYPIAKADLVGDWTMTGSMLDEHVGDLVENTMNVTFGEEDGQLYLTNLGGNDVKYPVTYAEDGLTIEPSMDYDTNASISGDFMLMSLKPVTFTFTENGGMVLESGLGSIVVNGENFAQIAVAGGATLAKKKADPVYTAAPADMVGVYTMTVNGYTASVDDADYSFSSSFRGSVSITEDGKAEMKGLLGKFTHTEIDYENETETTTESGFIGQYDSANSEITFSMPEDYTYRNESDTYYDVSLTQPFTVKVEKGENGMYTLTAVDAPVFQLVDVDGFTATYTVTANGFVATQKPTYSMTEDELMGKWNMSYTYYDEDETLSFEIKKNDADALVLTLDGDDIPHAVTMTTGGIVVEGYSNYNFDARFSQIFSGVATGGKEDVEFEFTADKNLALVSVLKWSTADHKAASTIPAGTVAAHPAKEHQPAPAPADMKGVYVMNVPTYTTVSGDTDFNDLAHSFRGSIVVDEDGKVQMQGLLGQFTKEVISGEPDVQDEESTIATASFVGQYDAAYETVTFSLADGFRFGDTDHYRWFSPVDEFTMNVAKGEDGKYVFTATEPIAFKAVDYDNIAPTCIVNLEGVTFVQQDTYEANMDDMLGDWQFNYEADGESKTVNFTVEEFDGAYTITNFDGDEDNVYDITTTLGGFQVKGLFQYDGFNHLFSGSNGYSATDVVFAFTDHNTFQLVTPLYYNTVANHTVTCIPEGTEAVRPVAKLGEAVASLEDLDPTKTYVLYNPNDKVYAVANPEQETNIWAANVPGEEAFNATAVDFDATSAYASWQVVKKGDKLMIYNVGAKKYLDTAHATGGEGGASTFNSEVTPLVYTELGDGKFAFSATGNTYDYFCAAKQFANTPMSVWSTSDHGSSWMFIENPNVEADAEVAATMTGITTVTETPAAQGGIYSVSGVKLNVTDVRKLQKGMYIVNGKKVLVK